MDKEKKPDKPKLGYWYKFYITECVLCGAGETVRERQYTPKPNDVAERYDYTQDACWSHFL